MLYFGASLVWWVPLLFALGVFAGVILLIPRAKDPNEIEVAAGVTKAELDAAVRQCAQAARELEQLAGDPKLSDNMAETLSGLATTVTEIAEAFVKDPRDISYARSLTDHHLDAVLEVARTYVALRQTRLNDEGRTRLDRIGETVQGYVEHFDSIRYACLANDFQRLEVATSALDQILKLEAPTATRSR